MKVKNKGKVYPSPPPPSSSSSSLSSVNGDGFLSVLKLLPAAILVIASALSAEDREVLAYLITRSLNTSVTSSLPSSSSSKAHDSINMNKKKKKSGKRGETHKPPEFDCECFDCYTSFWFRWDSSPNRELIHQAIEAFEDHLTTGEASASASASSPPSSSSSSQKSKRNHGRGKRKEKSGRGTHKSAETSTRPDESAADFASPEVSASGDVIPAVNDASSEGLFAGERSCPAAATADVAERGKEEVTGDTSTPEESLSIAVRTPAETERKGLARKVLPDVLGLFNSRLWSLWNPNA